MEDRDGRKEGRGRKRKEGRTITEGQSLSEGMERETVKEGNEGRKTVK